MQYKYDSRMQVLVQYDDQGRMLMSMRVKPHEFEQIQKEFMKYLNSVV